MQTEFIDALTAFLEQQIEGFQSLDECQQLTSGASQETYRLTISSQLGTQTLALRRSSSLNQDSGVAGQVGLAVEAQLLSLAGQSAIPVPKVLYVLQASDGMGEGFLMPWLEGETLGHKINYSAELANARKDLARQCGQILARIHALKPGPKLTDKLISADPATLVKDTWDLYQSLNTPQAMIDYTARWLLDNLPEDSRETLVHGDFRNGNLMVNKNGIEAVLDWELAHIGDPIRDLGWLCVNSWRFGNHDLAVGGFGETSDLLSAYEEESGLAVNLDDLRFWQVFGSFWWSVTTLHMAATWRSGETPSLERPVIGRRSSEAQMDCVNLLFEGEDKKLINDNSVDGTDLENFDSQLPRTSELLESVRVFLQKDVATSAQGRSAFLAKVAANSLGIIAREMSQGPTLKKNERARLLILLTDQPAGASLSKLRWELVMALRDKSPLNTSLLCEHLSQTVHGQLSIDQPKYSALKG